MGSPINQNHRNQFNYYSTVINWVYDLNLTSRNKIYPTSKTSQLFAPFFLKYLIHSASQIPHSPVVYLTQSLSSQSLFPSQSHSSHSFLFIHSFHLIPSQSLLLTPPHLVNLNSPQDLQTQDFCYLYSYTSDFT